MLLTVLGCSGSVPGPGTAASGYLLEAEGFTLGIELGTGTLAQLQLDRDPFAFDALLFSHLHPDHCADFSPLTVLRRYHPERPAGRLPVYAPAEAPSRFVAAYSPDAQDRAVTDLSDAYAFTALGPRTVHIGPFAVTADRAAHPCEAFAFRITHDGTTLTYTGDTGWSDAVTALARDADVLLSEASWTHADDRPPDLHLSGTEAGRLASVAGVGRLLITHVTPWTPVDDVLTEAKAEFAGEITRVRPREAYRL
ncbi:MBL fold metallo-hydrolase [Labedaea rhizosphaerae]|uniref:Ribonuclease BN (tRNA processing enzyme) n=1 Tax=Labedaea rhizosphaerae TaxID=598644 RepID=A0A4R6S9D1_LABRH|nr:MBL fold metallo-hydrolase [Labedaea rhizosphaerae]TDP96532.1 ribonuclease BN (tRNA processing enzyme) [Labedaea rhizosphaerae]